MGILAPVYLFRVICSDFLLKCIAFPLSWVQRERDSLGIVENV